jgi:hypothetical protein
MGKLADAKEIALDNAANVVAIIDATMTGGALTVATGFAASIWKKSAIKNHLYFEEQLRRLSNSNNLQEFLQRVEEDAELQSYFSEYIAKNCQTPSIKARNAMIIICKKMIDGEETLNHFTKTAMNTLMQLTDEDIAVFLVATDEEFLDGFFIETGDPDVKAFVKDMSKFSPNKPIYPFFNLRDYHLSHFAQKANMTINDLIMHIDRLVNCAALALDPRNGIGIGGSPAKYGINEYTRKLREVLLEEQRIFS